MPARRLAWILDEVIEIRRELRRGGVPEHTLDKIWNLTHEAFNRGIEYGNEDG